MKDDDRAVSAIIGAVIILGILGMVVLYVNGVYVPRQGSALEVTARDDTEVALIGLASDMGAGPTGPVTHVIPLRPPSATPPLLSGVIMSPARAEGRILFDGGGTNLTISHVLPEPAGGILAGDPTRRSLGDGTMRVYLLGNVTRGEPVGRLSATVGGSYLEPSTFRLDAGLLATERSDGVRLVSAPGLWVAAGGTASSPTTTVAWRIPLLSGLESGASGSNSVQVRLSPGPAASSGGGALTHNMTIRVDTDIPDAWERAFFDLMGPYGTVTKTLGANGRGNVTALILPPAGTPATTRAVSFDLSAVRYDVAFVERAG